MRKSLRQRPQSSGFPNTRWSLVRSSHGDDTRSRHAMEELCRAYWYPLYALARGMGLPPMDAEDITQSFFATMLDQNMMRRVSQEAGKLRSYLAASLRNHVNRERRRRQAKKRGGHVSTISIEQEEAEGRYLAEASSQEHPDSAFERRWAIALLDAAMTRLRKHYVRRGAVETFEALSPLLAETDRGTDYRHAAERLGMSEGAVRVAVFRLRKRYRDLVREQIADTVADPAEIDSEIEVLFAALAR